MHGPDLEDARARFKFTEIVRDSFRFLVQDYGFRIAEAGATYVRYEGDTVFVDVYHGRSSYFLGVEVGLRQPTNSGIVWRWSLQSILQLHGVAPTAGTTAFQSSSPDGVRRFVPILAKYLAEYGRAALTADPEEYRALNSQDSEWFIDYQADHQISMGEAAWSQRDFAKVIENFGSVRDRLSPAQIKKLEYARKHMPS